MGDKVPIDLAKRIAVDHGQQIVIVLAVDAENGAAQFVCHGTTKESEETALLIARAMAEIIFPGHTTGSLERIDDLDEQTSNQQ